MKFSENSTLICIDEEFLNSNRQSPLAYLQNYALKFLKIYKQLPITQNISILGEKLFSSFFDVI